MKNLKKLLEISSRPLCEKRLSRRCFRSAHIGANVELRDLEYLLAQKNGFVAFESALLVIPSESAGDVPGIMQWNDPRGWRQCYGKIPKDSVFFAQDLFAGPFGMSPECVFRLNPEDGEVSQHSPNLEAWAAKVLGDYDYETGWSLARAWQLKYGPLAPGIRLLPKKPFVIGGDYNVENLFPASANEAAAMLANLYQQIKRVPDGQPIAIYGWFGNDGCDGE